MSNEEPKQASTVDWCERWPEEGHSWVWTKHAGLPTVSTRTCHGCNYLDVTEVQDALRRFAVDRDDLLARLAAAEARGRQQGQQWAVDAMRAQAQKCHDDHLPIAANGWRWAADWLADSIAKEGSR